MTDYLPDVLVIALSIIAVIVSLFRARAEQTQAAAAAISELAEVSHDLRARLDVLENDNRTKQRELQELRQRAAQIPMLEAQVRQLSERLARVQMHHDHEIEARDREITRLRAALKAAGVDSA